MIFQRPVNNFKTTLGAAHTIGDTTLTLATGAGAQLGALAANEVYRLSVLSNPESSTETTLAIVEATGLSGDVLSGVTFVEGYTDVALTSGAAVRLRATAKTFASLNSAVNGLQAAVSSLQTVAETQVSGATTLAAGLSYVCLGTSANYTVTLPTAVGAAGQIIHVRMSGALTRLVTLATTNSQSIDGKPTRVMFSGEAATLMSDGSNWTKVGGKSLPMLATMRRVSTQSVSSGAAVASIAWNGTDLDNTGLMADASGIGKITIRRTGIYRVSVYIYSPAVVPGGFLTLQLMAGTASAAFMSETPASPGGKRTFNLNRQLALNAGDVIDAQAAAANGTSWDILGDPTSNASYIDVNEVSTW